MNAKTNTNAKNTENNFSLSIVDNSIFTVQEVGSQPIVRDSTTADTAILFNAVNGGGIPVKDVLGEVIEVTNIVICSAELPEDREKPEGKKVSKPCVNFFTASGEHYSTLSNGCVRATRNLLSCGLTPTPETPIKIKFKTISTPKGTAHTFDLIEGV